MHILQIEGSQIYSLLQCFSKASSGAIGISQSYPSHDSEYVFFELFKGMKHFGPIITEVYPLQMALCISAAEAEKRFQKDKGFKLRHCEAISLCLRQSRSAPIREAVSLPISYLVPSIMNYEVVLEQQFCCKCRYYSSAFRRPDN